MFKAEFYFIDIFCTHYYCMADIRPFKFISHMLDISIAGDKKVRDQRDTER